MYSAYIVMTLSMKLIGCSLKYLTQVYMKNGFFSFKLQEYIKVSGVSRDYIIDVFNKSSFHELSKCDLTTLSRWVSGKTVPSLYKQYAACIVLGIDLFKYIAELDPSMCVEGKKDKDTIEHYTRYLNGSNATIGYFPRGEHVEIFHALLGKYEHRRLLDPYFSNFSGFMSLREKVDSNNIEKSFYTYLFKEGGSLCGHLSFTDDCSDHLKVFGVYDESLKHSIGITPAYYIDAKIYWYMACCLFYFYLSKGNYKKNIYATMSTRDRNSWEYYKQVADGETLAFFSPTVKSNTPDRGLFYIKFNILKLLSKPTILAKFQEFLQNHNESTYLPIEI